MIFFCEYVSDPHLQSPHFINIQNKNESVDNETNVMQN